MIFLITYNICVYTHVHAHGTNGAQMHSHRQGIQNPEGKRWALRADLNDPTDMKHWQVCTSADSKELKKSLTLPSLEGTELWFLHLQSCGLKLVNQQWPLSTTLGPNVQACLCVCGCLCFCVCADPSSACMHVYFPLQKKVSYWQLFCNFFHPKKPTKKPHQDNIQKK